jgi:O-antigen/teichoic acid export membrane protein
MQSRDTTMNFNQISFPNFRVVAGLANDPLYRTSFFMAFSSVFNAGCGFFFWMMAARLYTVEQVGLATALISSLGLVILFSRLGFDFSIIRFISSENKGKVISTSLIITTAACILAGMTFILLADLFSPSMFFLKEPEYALAFLLIGAVNSAANVTGNAFVADRKADHYFLQNFFMALRIPALAPLAFLGVFGIFGSVGLGFLVGSIFGLFAIQRSIAAIRPEVDWDFIRRSFRFSSRNYVSGILSVAPTLIIPIMVLNMLGEAEAARYYIAFAIGNLVLIIPSSLGTSLFVEGSHGEGLRKSVIRAGAASMVLLVPAVLVLVLFGDKLLGMLSGEYVEAFDLLRIIALSSFPVAVYSLFVPIQNVRMRVEGVVKLNALRCVLLLGLSYVLVQRCGILGAGYAWMATYGVIVLGVGWVGCRVGWV